MRRVAKWFGIVFLLLSVSLLLVEVQRGLRIADTFDEHPLDRLEAQALLVRPYATDGYTDPGTAFHSVTLMHRLRLAATRMGIRVTDENPIFKLLPGSVGVFYRDLRTIVMSSTFSHDARVEILAHELGHALTPPSPSFQEMHNEVWASSVSFLLMQKDNTCGLACIERYTTYLAQHKMAFPVMRIYRTELDFAVTVLWGEP